jgi:hypothetical protein
MQIRSSSDGSKTLMGPHICFALLTLSLVSCTRTLSFVPLESWHQQHDPALDSHREDQAVNSFSGLVPQHTTFMTSVLLCRCLLVSGSGE